MENALQKIGYLASLASSNYEYTDIEAREIVDQLRAGVEKVAAAFAITEPLTPEPEPEPEPEQKGVPLNEGDVRWALDMLTFGRIPDAKALLIRAIQGEAR